jgi:hypothetical protein
MSTKEGQLTGKIYRGKTYIPDANGIWYELLMPSMKIDKKPAGSDAQHALGGKKLYEPVKEKLKEKPENILNIPDPSTQPIPPSVPQEPKNKPVNNKKKYHNTRYISDLPFKHRFELAKNIREKPTDILGMFMNHGGNIKTLLASLILGSDPLRRSIHNHEEKQHNLRKHKNSHSMQHTSSGEPRKTKQDILYERRIEKVPGETVAYGTPGILVRIDKNTEKSSKYLQELVRFFVVRERREDIKADFEKVNAEKDSEFRKAELDELKKIADGFFKGGKSGDGKGSGGGFLNDILAGGVGAELAGITKGAKGAKGGKGLFGRLFRAAPYIMTAADYISGNREVTGKNVAQDAGSLAGMEAGAMAGAKIPGPAWVKAGGAMVGGGVGYYAGGETVKKYQDATDTGSKIGVNTGANFGAKIPGSNRTKVVGSAIGSLIGAELSTIPGIAPIMNLFNKNKNQSTSTSDAPRNPFGSLTNQAKADTNPGIQGQGMGNKSVQIKKSDGSVIQRTGDAGWRDYNPGNISLGNIYQDKNWKDHWKAKAKKWGAVGYDIVADGNLNAVFPNKEAGDAARAKLLFTDPRYRSRKISDFMHSYTANVGQDYINELIAAVGSDKAPINMNLKEKQNLLAAMAKHEGNRQGTEKVISPPTKNLSKPKPVPRKEGDYIATNAAKAKDTKAVVVNNVTTNNNVSGGGKQQAPNGPIASARNTEASYYAANMYNSQQT